MVEVGCRVKHEGIAELAKKIGVSSSKLEKQLRLYRVGLVVNQANATSRPGLSNSMPMSCGGENTSTGRLTEKSKEIRSYFR